MDNVAAYLPQLLITSGIALLAIEVLVLGFATFILFFLGISLMLTGLLVWLGLLPDTWSVLMISNAVLTAFLAVFLWKPLRKLQNKTDNKKVRSDFDGHRFFTPAAVDGRGLTTYMYSGIKWQLKSEELIAAGIEVEILRAEVGTLWVKPV